MKEEEGSDRYKQAVPPLPNSFSVVDYLINLLVSIFPLLKENIL